MFRADKMVQYWSFSRHFH